jgi:tetratricopeptide (TPR) repeat protein
MQTTDPTPPSDQKRLGRATTAVLVLAVLGATLAAYQPALHGGLLWDDAAHITARSLQGWDGLWNIWFRLGSTQQYYPVLHSAFWVEHRLWGDSVLGYHLINVSLHAAAACLFAVALARFLGRVGAPEWPEWLAAGIFALHPVCVESVAWISEQKNTLSLVFYLLSAVAYLRFDRERGRAWYALAFGLFLLALLSKSVTATLPGALFLALAWRRPELSWRRDVLPLVPLFVAGACVGLFTAWVERNYVGARGGAYALGLAEHGFLAGRIVWFYLGKLVWPQDLAFIYPHWRVAADWAWSLGLIGVAAALAVLFAVRRACRAPLFAMLFFLGSAFPVLGFFNVYPFIFSYVADHWQYLPCLGVIALFAEGAGAAGRAAGKAGGLRGRAARAALAAASAGLLAVLLVLARRQSALYRDVGILYSDTLAKDPDCWMARNNLGIHLMDTGALGAAISQLEEAIRLKPDYPEAHNNLGNALSKVPGRLPEAIAEFEAALRLEPKMTEAHANLGIALVKTQGGVSAGIAQLKEALQGNEDDPGGFEARFNLGNALARLGRWSEAAGQYEAALRLQPESSDVRINLGGALVELGRGPEAVEQYRAALRIDPGSQAAHFDLGRALRNVGDGHEAIAEYLQALRIGPDSAQLRSSLGSAYYRQGRMDEAIAQFREAVRLAPGYADAHYNLGLALLRVGREDEAAREFTASGRPRP